MIPYIIGFYLPSILRFKKNKLRKLLSIHFITQLINHIPARIHFVGNFLLVEFMFGGKYAEVSLKGMPERLDFFVRRFNCLLFQDPDLFKIHNAFLSFSKRTLLFAPGYTRKQSPAGQLPKRASLSGSSGHASYPGFEKQ